MEQRRYRNEIKYLCTSAQLALIENRIKELCSLDSHAGSDGNYLVTSLYLDDYENSGYYDNQNGIDPREKFRIRIYNRDMNKIWLECKQKCVGMTHKESCVMSRSDCISVLHQGPLVWKADQEPLFNKFFVMWQTRRLQPKVIVEYERTAYTYQMGNVRITFDRNITASSQVENFGQLAFCRPVMPLGQHILEVKYDELIPDYIYNAVGIDHLRHIAFSKYFICRRLINA